MDTITLPEVGSTVYARWAVGPAQRGSGWLDPRTADELDAWVVAETWPALGTVLVRVPNGGTITIRPGQYLTEQERRHTGQHLQGCVACYEYVAREIAAEMREREAIQADAENERDGYRD